MPLLAELCNTDLHTTFRCSHKHIHQRHAKPWPAVFVKHHDAIEGMQYGQPSCHFLAQTSHANLTETKWEYPPTVSWNANVEAASLSLPQFCHSSLSN